VAFLLIGLLFRGPWRSWADAGSRGTAWALDRSIGDLVWRVTLGRCAKDYCASRPGEWMIQVLLTFPSDSLPTREKPFRIQNLPCFLGYAAEGTFLLFSSFCEVATGFSVKASRTFPTLFFFLREIASMLQPHPAHPLLTQTGIFSTHFSPFVNAVRSPSILTFDISSLDLHTPPILIHDVIPRVPT